MAILFMDGFDVEQQSTLVTFANRWNGGTSGNPFIVANTGAFTGAAALNPVSNNNAKKPLGSNYTRLLLNCWAKVSSGITGIYRFQDGATDQCTVNVLNSGTIEIRTGGTAGTLITSAAAVITSGVYFWLGIDITFAGSGTGAFTIQVNGSTILSGAGTTITTVNSYTNQVVFDSNGGASLQVYVDDLIIMDTTGGSPTNALMKNCRIETLFPLSDSVVAFTPNTGVTNFSRVQDTSGSDAGTSYVSTASASTVSDLYGVGYTLSDPASFITTQLSYVAAAATAASVTVASQIKSGSFTSAGATNTTSSTTYIYYQDFFANDPNTSAAWTRNGIHSATIGMTGSSATTTLRVSTVKWEVLYQIGSGAAQLPYWNRTLQMAPFAWEDIAVDDAMARDNWLVMRRKPETQQWSQTVASVYKFIQYDIVGSSLSAMSVQKSIQYAVLSPPLTGVSVQKSVQYAVLAPINALTIQKSIAYVVLEAPPALPSNKKALQYATFFKRKKKRAPKHGGGRSIISAKRLQFFIMT